MHIANDILQNILHIAYIPYDDLQQIEIDLIESRRRGEEERQWLETGRPFFQMCQKISLFKMNCDCIMTLTFLLLKY